MKIRIGNLIIRNEEAVKYLGAIHSANVEKKILPNIGGARYVNIVLLFRVINLALVYIESVWVGNQKKAVPVLKDKHPRENRFVSNDIR